MRQKQWIDWESDQCPNCGNSVKVFTDAEQDNIYPVAYDGDAAKCVECKWEGSFEVIEDDEGNARGRLSEGNIDELDDMGNDPL